MGLGVASLLDGIRAAGLNGGRAARPLVALSAARQKVVKCAKAAEDLATQEQSFARSWRQAVGLANAVIRSWQNAEQMRAELAAELVERLDAGFALGTVRAAFKSVPRVMSLDDAADRWEEVSSKLRQLLGLPLAPSGDMLGEEDIGDAVGVLAELHISTVRMAAFRRERPRPKNGRPWVSAAAQHARKRAYLRRLAATPAPRREKAWPSLINSLRDPLNPDGGHELADLEEQIAFLRVGLDLAKRLELPAALPAAKPEKKSKRGQSRPSTSAPRPEPLEAFAARVRATHQALRSRDTRPAYLRDRQFISDLFGAADWGLDLAAFKRRLLDARRKALLTLTRGDLIAALPPEKVRASLVEQGERQFHYVEMVERGE